MLSLRLFLVSSLLVVMSGCGGSPKEPDSPARSAAPSAEPAPSVAPSGMPAASATPSAVPSATPAAEPARAAATLDGAITGKPFHAVAACVAGIGKDKGKVYLEIYDAACPYPHRIHTGVDIAGPYGTQIVAADTGVVYLYPGSVGYGNMVLMVHGNGYSTVYGHLAGYAPGLRSGMIVARGTTIAFEGSTGWSTGPHLHFEVRVNGQHVNPIGYL